MSARSTVKTRRIEMGGLREYRPTEILNGTETMMSPAASWKHNTIVDNIVSVFNKTLTGMPCRARSVSNLNISNHNKPIPDVMVVCKRNIIKKNGVYGPPRLVIEVLSPSTKKNDKGYKKDLYEQFGVPEYWIIDPEPEDVEVYKLTDKYVLDTIYQYKGTDDFAEEEVLCDAEIQVGSVEGLTIKLSEIFDDDWGE